jgi:hypothetical protein
MEINRRAFVKSAAALGIVPTIVQAGQSTKTQSIPTRKIGNNEISRLIIGGNPFSGIAHAEPMVYSNELFKKYFTSPKVVETLTISAQNGINTFLGRIDDKTCGFMDAHAKTAGQYLPWIGQTAKKPMNGATRQEIIDNIKLAKDHGAIGCYVQGQSADYYVEEEQLAEIEILLGEIRKLEMIAGVGAHDIKTVRATEKAKLQPDFYMKTFNRLEYACPDFPGTVDFMSQIEIPWIAFKVLAAGRLKPEEGFAAALEANADFLCVGMFDFQVERNVQLAQKLFNGV